MVWLKKYSAELLLFVILIGAAVLMHAYAFITDDAFISFTYARNFAEGNGLTWYPRSSEYGYTSFLFTLLTGMLMKLGVDVPAAAHILSVPAAFFGILFTYKIARLISPVPAVALLAVAALASNPTYAAYATSGLEMALAISLVLGAYYYVFSWAQTQSARHLRLASCFAAAALLTRLDMALLLLPLYGLSFKQVNTLAKASLIPVCAVLALLIFCTFYYGQMLPSTAYAKATGWHVEGGLNYLYTFLKAQYFVPVALTMLALLGIAYFTRQHAALLGAVMLWGLYNLRVGGDFMEFRFILPMLPFFYLLVFDFLKKHWLYLAVGGCLALAGNVVQPLYFKEDNIDEGYIESTDLLDHWVNEEAINWVQVGKKLHELFYTGSADDVKIAVSGAGAIPYYSRLPSFDLHGLNTRAVFANADPFLDRPGHRLKARLNFVRDSRVNLLIDHPLFIRRAVQPHSDFRYKCYESSLWFTHKSLWYIPVVFIPVNEDYYLLTHYLSPHLQIEKQLKTGAILDGKVVKKQIRCQNPNDAALMEWLESP